MALVFMSILLKCFVKTFLRLIVFNICLCVFICFCRSGGSTFNPIPTLDFLRGTLQHRINKDIQNVYQKYARFFQMAVENIQANNGKDSVTEDHVLSVFRTSLEEVYLVIKLCT